VRSGSGSAQRVGGIADAPLRRPAHHRDVRSFLFVSSFDPDAARRAVLVSGLDPDLVVISPSGAARDDLERALPLP
jgi:hypothetical protein